MVLQETFGEFSSTERLRSLIRLICQLPGTYEVLIQTGEGEEGILHCANDTIRNAACRNLSGLDALSVILSWPRGKYWLEELPVLPTRSMNFPLDRLFAEVEKINPATSVAPDREDEESTQPQPEAKGAPAAVEKPPTTRIEEKPEEAPIVPVEKKEPPVVVKPEPEPEPAPITTPPAPVEKPKTDSDDLPHRIAAIKGAESVIVTSVDGMLLANVNIEPTNDQVQMVALLGEALEQIGEIFTKGRFKHGSIDMGTERILLHTFRQSYIGTFIDPKASAAVVGGEIEDLIHKELEG